MRRIHFDSQGNTRHHYFFWQPWGCLGCLGRTLIFLILLFFFMLLLSQFRSCTDGSANREDAVEEVVVEVEEPNPGVPPIDDTDIIDQDGRRVVSNRLNVLFQAEVGFEGIETWKTRFKELYPGEDYKVIFCDYNTKLMALQVPPSERQRLITELPQQIPDIPFMVFEEGVMENSYIPSDPEVSEDKTWFLTAIDAPLAWDYTLGTETITIAVVDSYFDLDNPELASSNIIFPYNVQNGGNDVTVPDGFNPSQPNPILAHGTMVSSLAIGAHNQHGSAGMAPKCSFMPVSLGERFGCLAMLQGLLYAVNHGASVINISAGLSFSQDMSSVPVEQQIALARNELLAQEDVWKYVFDMCQKYYVTIVWAAGNENVFTALDASKRGANTIKVSSVDRNMSKASFSNFGNFPDQNIYESTVSAPGEKIYGEFPGGSAAPVDGTSFSAPIVAGTVGLMKSIDATLTTAQIIDILKSTGTEVSRNSTIGPAINSGKALKKVFDGLTDFSTLSRLRASLTSRAAVSTTLLMPFNSSVSDPTVLPPLLTIGFSFAPEGDSIIYTNLRDNSRHAAKVTVAAEANKFIIRQAESPQTASNIPPATFTIAPAMQGKAQITCESDLIPSVYKPYIK